MLRLIALAVAAAELPVAAAARQTAALLVAAAPVELDLLQDAGPAVFVAALLLDTRTQA